MPRRTESIFIPAGELRLEAALTLVAGARTAGVITHSYPRFGGNMHSGVVLAIDAAMADAGLSTLRFNFRGTGASSGSFDRGRGEQDDLRAAVQWLRDRDLAEHIVVAGYSFGAIVALHATATIPDLAAFVAVAPPLSRMPFVDRPPHTAELFVVGARDHYCTADAALRCVAAAGPLRQLHLVADGDHSLDTHRDEIAAVVTRFLTTADRAEPFAIPADLPRGLSR